MNVTETVFTMFIEISSSLNLKQDLAATIERLNQIDLFSIVAGFFRTCVFPYFLIKP
jgi:hypothetical protein